MLTATAPAVVLGADLPDALLLASPLPGARCTTVAAGALAESERAVALAPAALASGALQRAEEQRAARHRADLLAEQHDAWQVRDALTDLADAVPGHTEQPGDDEGSADIAVVAHLAGLSGLPADPVRLRRAVTDSQVSGRDRIAALTAACDASARRVELPSGWWRSAGPPLLVTITREDAGEAWCRCPQQGGGGMDAGYRLWTPTDGAGPRLTDTTAAQVDSTALVLQPLLNPARPASLRELLRMALRGPELRSASCWR